MWGKREDVKGIQEVQKSKGRENNPEEKPCCRPEVSEKAREGW